MGWGWGWGGEGVISSLRVNPAEKFSHHWAKRYVNQLIFGYDNIYLLT